VPEEILVAPLNQIILNGSEANSENSTHKVGQASSRPRASTPGHVTTSMPCTIIDVPVSVGDKVKAGQPVLVTEAMKMETEIHAPISGEIMKIYVTKGEQVTPQETLIEIQS